jgi:hypothetical protein
LLRRSQMANTFIAVCNLQLGFYTPPTNAHSFLAISFQRRRVIMRRLHPPGRPCVMQGK